MMPMPKVRLKSETQTNGKVSAQFNSSGLVLRRRLSNREAKDIQADPGGAREIQLAIDKANALGGRVTVFNDVATMETVITATIPYDVLAKLKGAA